MSQVSGAPQAPQQSVFDNCNASRDSGNDLHNVADLQTVKTKLDCPEYLSFYLINATSLAKPHAMQLLQTELLNKDFDIVLVTETWFTQMHLDTYVAIPNYVLFRRDRGRRGGGVCAYVRSDIIIAQLHHLKKLIEL